ncbi:MAG: hypothetical protein ACYSUY_07920 [Planctomycetota bacterium]
MVSKKIVCWLTIIVMCSLLLSAGCTQDVKETAQPKIVIEEEKPKVVVEEEKPKVVEEEKPKVVVEEEKPKVVEKEQPTIELALKYTPQNQLSNWH